MDRTLQAISILFILALASCENSAPSTLTTRTPITKVPGRTDVMSDPSDALYAIDMNIGGKVFKNIQVDTGSSNLIVLGDAQLCPNCVAASGIVDFTPSTYTPVTQPLLSGRTLSIKYGIGDGQFQLYEENIALTSSDTPVQYPLGVFVSGRMINNILGLAYPANLVRTQDFSPLPFFDEYVLKNNLDNLFTLNFCPPDFNGNFMTFGKIDSAVPSETIRRTPILTNSLLDTPMHDLYHVAPIALWIGDAKIGTFPPQQDGFLTIIDSGTSLLYLPSEMIQSIASYYAKTLQIPTAFWDLSTSTAVAISNPDFRNQLTDLQIEFPSVSGGTFKVNVSPNTYAINIGTSDKPKFISGLSSAPPISTRNPSIRFVLLGDVFLQNTYTVFDRQNQQIGFASNHGLCTAGSS